MELANSNVLFEKQVVVDVVLVVAFDCKQQDSVSRKELTMPLRLSWWY
jgi:hypothetical protein